MNVRAKFIRLVLASAVGSLLWAGCATNTTDVVLREPAGAERPAKVIETANPLVTDTAVVIDRDILAMAPRDQTKRRPDTHPELRTGLWQSTYRDTGRPTVPVIEAPVLKLPEEESAADTTHLLSYDPVVVNIAADTTAPVEIAGEPGTVVFEAAGAERHPKRFWRWNQRRVEPAPRTIIRPRTDAPTIEVQPSEPLPHKNEVIIPSDRPTTPLKNENTGPLLKDFFVQTKSN